MEKNMEKNKHKKIIVGTAISLCTLIIVYFGMAAYFKNHFYFGSEINMVNVSGKTVEEVNTKMASEIKSYKLNLKEKDGKSEQIHAEDIGLKYNSEDEFKKLKDKQGSYKWILAFFSTKDSKMTAEVSYDKKLLQEKLDNLSCTDSKNTIEPKNPSFKYSNNGYEIVNEVNGNKVNKSALYDNVVKAIVKGETTIDLQSLKCYVNPKYTTKSKETTEIKNTLNKYVASKVTYTIGDSKESIDASTINKWLTVNEDFKVAFDEEKVKEYLKKLSDTYSTIGKTRKFTASSGSTINVGGGDYGWDINTAKETQELIAAIKEGKDVKKEPVYSQKAASHGSNDIGNTYVEIDMGRQHLWFYKNGSLVVQGDVVTGNVSNGHATPEGIYSLKYKERHATLKGQGYASPVDYWMPFNGGIGIHDANWRPAFGGSIYRGDGSHGCVNSPHELARTIYENIEEGTPIVCYY
ncbi:L,D-transpeptidase family protein [Clostridium sp. P21]|uniref:L,D-transpeptidase family protein n=1 Tax=Clostridium muellerianum TaxID=2716538 RepID=A0A7Y0EKJ8_9CLOT|nr:L,D-transpeptidase/peptidoglycan binding protein [Clostridium muellerianum]NMM65171.1 L,D-transpeptidase family protein [Clostridium muellerianum]